MTVTTKKSFTTTQSLYNGKALLWLAHLGPALMTVFFMWLPFGFSLTGLLEEWGVIGLFSRSGLLFLTDASSAMSAHALRPLTILPHAIAYFLDPNTFNYWHILLIAALIIKGCALSVITTRITGSLKWGMLASVLVIIFPADTMQLSFRSIHINWALSLTLMGSAIFLHAIDQNRKIRSYVLSALGSLLIAAGCAMYEVSLLFITIPALVIFIQIGLKKFIPHIKAYYVQHLIWVSGGIAYIAYVIHTAPLVHSYQGAIAGNSAFSTLKLYYPKIFTIGLMRSVFGGWIDAFRITWIEFSSYWYLAITTAALLSLIFFVSRKSKSIIISENEKNPSLALICRLAIIGIVLICVGYSPFIFSLSHMAVSQRTFLYAAPGATLLFLSLFLALSYYSKIATSVLAATLIFIGLGAQLFQFHHYIDISKRQQLVLRDIVQNFDGNAINKTLVILDYSNQLNRDWMFLNGNLAAALSYIYGKPISTLEVCYMPSHEWQQPDSLGRKGNCEKTVDGWTFSYPTPISGPGIEAADQPPSKKLPKSEVVTLVIGNQDMVPVNHELDAYRQDLKHNTSPMSARYRGVTETAPWLDFLKFRDQAYKDEYYWGFGNWWSLDIPTAGSGWRDVEWEAMGFSHESSAWKNAPRASLYFELTPKTVPYVISGNFNAFANEKIRSEMQIRVNGTSTPIQWDQDGNFSGTINSEALKAGRNVLEFVSEVDDKYYGLSAKLSWVKIAKQTH
jgi:hypothetical protein